MTHRDVVRFARPAAWLEACSESGLGLFVNGLVACMLASLLFDSVNLLVFDHDYESLGRGSAWTDAELGDAYQAATGRMVPATADGGTRGAMRENLSLFVERPPGVEPGDDGERDLWIWWKAGAAPDAEDYAGYAMRLSYSGRARDLRIGAEFFPIVNGRRLHWRWTDTEVLSRRPFRRLGIAPTTVRHEAAELADFFKDGIETVLPRAPGAAGVAIPQGDDATALRDIVLELLSGRLGARGPASASDAPRPDTEPGTLVDRTRWSRVINGNNAWGVIQYATVAVFLTIMMIAAAQRWRLRQEWAYLGSQEVFPSETSGTWAPDEAAVDEKNAYIDGARKRRRDRGCREPSPVLEIAGAAYGGLKDFGPRHEALPGLVNAMVEACDRQADASTTYLRSLVPVVQFIGFIGTVVGVSDSMGGISEVVTADEVERGAAVRAVGASLATAFDTTLIALVCVVPAMLVRDGVLRGHETLLLAVQHRALALVMSPTPVATLIAALGGQGDPRRLAAAPIPRPTPQEATPAASDERGGRVAANLEGGGRRLSEVSRPSRVGPPPAREKWWLPPFRGSRAARDGLWTWILWMAVNGIGWGACAVVILSFSRMLTDPSSGYAGAGGILAALRGMALAGGAGAAGFYILSRLQWLVLRNLLPTAALWAAVTAASGFVALTLCRPLAAEDLVIWCFLITPGIMHWLTLRKHHVANAWLWVVVSPACVTIAYVVARVAFGIAPPAGSWDSLSPAFGFYYVVGVLYGAVTGLSLPGLSARVGRHG